jgi:hypothetical protein
MYGENGYYSKLFANKEEFLVSKESDLPHYFKPQVSFQMLITQSPKLNGQSEFFDATGLLGSPKSHYSKPSSESLDDFSLDRSSLRKSSYQSLKAGKHASPKNIFAASCINLKSLNDLESEKVDEKIRNSPKPTVRELPPIQKLKFEKTFPLLTKDNVSHISKLFPTPLESLKSTQESPKKISAPSPKKLSQREKKMLLRTPISDKPEEKTSKTCWAINKSPMDSPRKFTEIQDEEKNNATLAISMQPIPMYEVANLVGAK